MKNDYLLSDACNALNIKPGRIQNWMVAGWITPSKQVARGSGTRNVFTHSDIIVIEMLRIMIDMGIPRKYAGEVAKEFQDSEVFRRFVLESSKLKISYFEIFVEADGQIKHQVIQRVPGGFWESRKMYNPAIVYSINLNKIVNTVELALNGK